MQTRRRSLSGISHRPRREAFSLIELSVVILVIGLFSAGALLLTDNEGSQRCVEETDAEIVAIQEALENFALREQRYPKPANPTLGTNDGNYGLELTNGVNPADASFDTLEPAGLTASNGVLIGNLPFVTLGLANSMDTDCWNQHYTYAVSNALTSRHPTEGYPEPKTTGRIGLRAGTPTSAQILSDYGSYVILSHGPDGVGARKRGASAASASPCVGNGIDVANCDSDHLFFTVPRVGGEATLPEHFDDIISTHVRTMNCTASTEGWLGNCAGLVPALNNGATTIVTNTNANYTGNANFSCTNGVLTSSGEVCTPSCIADGQPSGGNPAACCNGDSDGNGTCGTQASQSCCYTAGPIHTSITIFSGPQSSCTTLNDAPVGNCHNGSTGYYEFCGAGPCGSSCIADGSSSGGNPAACCNGDSDGNGTCGTQASCTPCATYQGTEADLYGTSNPGVGCWNYTKADCSTEIDMAPCDGTPTSPPSGWPVCGGPPPCIADGQPSGGNPANCCNGDSDGNGTCGTQTSCIADGQPSGGNPANCCNGDSDGNGTCGTQSACGATEDYGSCTGGTCDVCCNGALGSCPNNHGGDIGLTMGRGCDGSICSPPCLADGSSSGGTPTACCNGDSDGNGTCGTQAACNGYYDPQGGWGPGTLVCPGCDYIGQHKVLSYHNCDIGPCAPPPTPDQPGDAEASIIATLIAAGQNPNDYQICVASGSGSCPSPGCDAWFENNVEVGYAVRK